MLIPESPSEWIKQSEDKLCMQRCAYWINLRSEPPSQNTESVTVYIPRINLFTVDALKAMMQQIQVRGIL